jgi:hypothetical protein
MQIPNPLVRDELIEARFQTFEAGILRSGSLPLERRCSTGGGSAADQAGASAEQNRATIEWRHFGASRTYGLFITSRKFAPLRESQI